MNAALVDASVAAERVVEEDHSANAVLLRERETLHAPNHWRAEAVNVLWTKVVRGDLTAADAGLERRLSGDLDLSTMMLWVGDLAFGDGGRIVAPRTDPRQDERS